MSGDAAAAAARAHRAMRRRAPRHWRDTAPQEIERRRGVRVIEIRSRLVGEHQRRPVDDGARDGHTLRLPLRQFARVAACEIGDADGLEEGPDAKQIVRHARKVLREPQVVGDVEGADEMEPLRHEADTAPAPAVACGAGKPAEIRAADDDRPRGRRRQRSEDVQQRRLAAARRTGKQPVLAGPGAPFADPEHGGVAVPMRDSGEREHPSASRPFPPLVDLALDGLGNVGPQQLADFLVDGLDHLDAGPIDDRLQLGAELLAQPRVREDVDPLQHLHADLFGQRLPARPVVGNRHPQGSGSFRDGRRLGWRRLDREGRGRRCDGRRLGSGGRGRQLVDGRRLGSRGRGLGCGWHGLDRRRLRLDPGRPFGCVTGSPTIDRSDRADPTSEPGAFATGGPATAESASRPASRNSSGSWGGHPEASSMSSGNSMIDAISISSTASTSSGTSSNATNVAFDPGATSATTSVSSGISVSAARARLRRISASACSRSSRADGISAPARPPEGR